MDFCKDHFVVETLEFGEEGVNECECGLVLEGVELSWGVLGDVGMGRRDVTYRPIKRVSRLCFRNIRFSCFAQSMLVCKTCI